MFGKFGQNAAPARAVAGLHHGHWAMGNFGNQEMALEENKTNSDQYSFCLSSYAR